MMVRLLEFTKRILGVSGFVVLLSVLTVASVSLNLVLARQLRSLSNVRSLKAADRFLKVGTSVPPIAANRLDGQGNVLISFETEPRPTVLYVFTPTCGWCARNLANFSALVNRRESQYRILGLSLSDHGLEEYIAANGLTVPIYSGLSTDTVRAYKLGSTPQTIVISPKGRVLRNWVGAYVGDQKSQVEAFFGVTLPGLRELPEAGEKR